MTHGLQICEVTLPIATDYISKEKAKKMSAVIIMRVYHSATTSTQAECLRLELRRFFNHIAPNEVTATLAIVFLLYAKVQKF